MSVALIGETIANAQAVVDIADDEVKKELTMLIKDLEAAKLTIFVKTAEAKPLVQRCWDAARALSDTVEHQGNWGDEAQDAFASFERAVTKLRNTILVRTQRAT